MCPHSTIDVPIYMCPHTTGGWQGREAVRVGGQNRVRLFLYFLVFFLIIFETGREAVRVSGGETVTLSLEDVSLVV